MKRPQHPAFPLINAIKNIAAKSIPACGKTLFFVFFVLAAAGCALPDKPTRAVMYDFGPGLLPDSKAPLAQAGPGMPGKSALPLAIAEIATAGGALENQAVLYRLGYTDAQQLRPYAQARWSMPPAQLVRQRLRERLSQNRVVLTAREGVALNRSQNASLPLLRLELEEFSQLFSTPADSVGLLRLHATLVDITPAGEKLVAQRSLVVQQPAPSADAAGGVRALTAATDAAIDQIDDWLRGLPAR